MLGALTLWHLHFSVSDYEGKYTSIPQLARCRNGPCTERAVKVAVPR
jgi:hypothetical protein